MNLANIALLSSSAMAGVAAVAREGSFSTQPYAASPVMQFEGFDFYPEGIAYDPKRDRVLIGTLSNADSAVNGRIYAAPYASPSFFGDDDDAGVVYRESDMTLVFDGTSGRYGYVLHITGFFVNGVIMSCQMQRHRVLFCGSSDGPSGP